MKGRKKLTNLVDSVQLLSRQMQLHREEFTNVERGIILAFEFLLVTLTGKNRVRDIAESQRNTGNTKWLIKSISLNPNVIVVFKSQRHAKEAEQWYNEEFADNNPDSNFKPIFKSMDDDFKGLPNMPMIFDNACLM
jgi:hypothetical protein